MNSPISAESKLAKRTTRGQPPLRYLQDFDDDEPSRKRQRTAKRPTETTGRLRRQLVTLPYPPGSVELEQFFRRMENNPELESGNSKRPENKTSVQAAPATQKTVGSAIERVSLGTTSEVISPIDMNSRGSVPTARPSQSAAVDGSSGSNNHTVSTEGSRSEMMASSTQSDREGITLVGRRVSPEPSVSTGNASLCGGPRCRNEHQNPSTMTHVKHTPDDPVSFVASNTPSITASRKPSDPSSKAREPLSGTIADFASGFFNSIVKFVGDNAAEASRQISISEADLRADLAHLRRELSASKSELEGAKSKVDSTTSELTTAKAECESVKLQLTTVKEERDTLKVELNTSKSSMTAYKQETEKLHRQDSERTQGLLAQLKEKLTKEQAEVIALQSRIGLYFQASTDAGEKLRKADSESQELRETVGKLELELARYKRDERHGLVGTSSSTEKQ